MGVLLFFLFEFFFKSFLIDWAFLGNFLMNNLARISSNWKITFLRALKVFSLKADQKNFPCVFFFLIFCMANLSKKKVKRSTLYSSTFKFFKVLLSLYFLMFVQVLQNILYICIIFQVLPSILNHFYKYFHVKSISTSINKISNILGKIHLWHFW